MKPNELSTKLQSTPQISTINDFFIQNKQTIANALPNTITPDKLLGLFSLILKSSPQVALCSQKSLVAAVIQSIQLGLMPGAVGHIHLIPFDNYKNGVSEKECQLVIGYRGIVELVNRSQKATILGAEVVYAKDKFIYEQGLDPVLKHIPATGDRGEKIGVYCVAKNLIANEKVFIYLQKEEVEKVKAASKASKSPYSPWNTWAEEMWKKTAVKKISKLLPLSMETERAIMKGDETTKTEISADIVESPDETNWEQPEQEVAPTETFDMEMEEPQEEPEPEPEPPQEFSDGITDKQKKCIFAICKQLNISDEEMKEKIYNAYGVESRNDLTKEQARKVIDALKKKQEAGGR